MTGYKDVPVMSYLAVMDAHEPSLRRVRSIGTPFQKTARYYMYDVTSQ